MSFLELILSGISTLVMGAINLLFGTFFDEITKPAKASAGEGALPFDPFRMFDKIFGGAIALDQAIQIIAVSIGILLVLAILVLTMVRPGGNTAESPFSVVGRTLIFLPLTVMSGKFCVIFSDTLGQFMGLLLRAEDSALTAPDIGENVRAALEYSVGANVGSEIVLVLMALFLAILLFVDLFKLACIIVEEYVVLGILAHMAPLAICTGCTKKTSFVFSSWVNMFISHMLLLVLSQWSLIVFRLAIQKPTDDFGGVLWLVAIDVFLRVSCHWDDLLGKLGLKALVDYENGFIGSFIMASKAAKGLTNVVKSTFGGAVNGVRQLSNTAAPGKGGGKPDGREAKAQDPNKSGNAVSRMVGRSTWGNIGAAAGASKANMDIASGRSREVSPGVSDFGKGMEDAYNRRMYSSKIPDAPQGQSYGKMTAPNNKLDMSQPAYKSRTDSAGHTYGDHTTRTPKARATADAIGQYMGDSGRSLSTADGSGRVGFSGNVTASSWNTKYQMGSFYADGATFYDENNRAYGRMECGEFVIYKPDQGVMESLGDKTVYPVNIGGKDYVVEPVGEMMYTNSAGEVLTLNNEPVTEDLHCRGIPIGGRRE